MDNMTAKDEKILVETSIQLSKTIQDAIETLYPFSEESHKNLRSVFDLIAKMYYGGESNALTDRLVVVVMGGFLAGVALLEPTNERLMPSLHNNKLHVMMTKAVAELGLVSAIAESHKSIQDVLDKLSSNSLIYYDYEILEEGNAGEESL